jgi:hypothetical protein
MKSVVLAGAAAVALGLLGAGSASATIVFATGNPGGGLDVVTLPQQNADDGTDFFLTGTVNPDDTEVLIRGLENIDSAASGQARVVASDSSTLNFLEFTLETGFAADVFVFNLNGRGHNGNVTISATDQFGNTYTSSAFALGNGQNFFNLTTLDDQLIRSVSFTSTALNDVRQIRFGGVQEFNVPLGIPEPGAWALMIMGFGGAGVALRRRRAALAA